MMKYLIKSGYEQLIFKFRRKKVMVDTDLAVLYGTTSKALKQQVKWNITRFPGDFMFELNSDETFELVTNCDRFALLKHSSVQPVIFT